jgi:hypothetical protein
MDRGLERPATRARHTVQLFDDSASLVDGVADFVESRFQRGGIVLAVLSADHWIGVAGLLKQRRVAVDEAIASGRLTVRDVDVTLQSLLRKGRPQRALFDRTVGELVRTLAARGPLHVYGEMVDVLAAHGDFRLALQVEEMWNDLGQSESFTLLCGYSAVSFGNPRSTDSLRQICGAHSHVQAKPGDSLATFLLGAASLSVDAV